MSAPAVTPASKPVQHHSHGGPGNALAPAKTRAALIRSFDAADFPLLNGREEEWRFTPLRRLRGLHDGSFSTTPSSPLYVFDSVPAGVSITRVGKDDARVGSVLTPFDRPSAVAFGQVSDALLVSVARNAVVDEPVMVALTGGRADGASFAHTVVEIGESAQVTIVLDQSGSATLADNVEIIVGDNASVKLVTIADWDRDSVQLQHHKARIGRDARLVHISVTLGGDVVRQFVSADFAGRGGEIEAYGIYFADAGQHLEHRLLVDHESPDCRSRVTYRGALQGKGAHTVWVGDVLIQAEATGTDTYEINRNLVLTDGARADSVPNLEIETGEIIGAGHASATGRFDDEQLFYLQARGIPAGEARRLVVRGFFAELVAKIGIESVQDHLMATIEQRLASYLEAGA